MTDAHSSRPSLQAALEALGAPCPPATIAELAALIDTSMGGAARFYHHLPHAQMVADAADPLEVLTGLFHDLVQVGVDQGIPALVEAQLEGLIDSPTPLNFALRDSPATRADRIFNLVRSTFRFVPGQTLSPFGGQNEFLTALATAKSLSKVLDEPALLAISLGIEATIPFRSEPDGFGTAALGALEDINQRFALRLSATDLQVMLRRAVRIANRDVRSFGEDDLIALLDDTWALMLESSADLRRTEDASVFAYRRTLQRMTRFLGSLSAPLIFRRFEDEPAAPHFAGLMQRGSRNLTEVAAIMQHKLLATGLLEAAAGSAGARFAARRHARAGQPDAASVAPALLPVLGAGRDAPIEFDIRQSPLAHAIALSMTPAEVKSLVDELDPATPIDPGLLARVPAPIAAQAQRLSRAFSG